VDRISHADIAALVSGSGQLPGSGDAASGEVGAIGAMLRAFSSGGQATLGQA